MLDKKNFYINGEWVLPNSSKELEVINPAKEEVCGIISIGDSKDTNTAVDAAKNAFYSWSKTSKEERLTLLNNLYEIYKSKWDDMSKIISMEMGAPIDWSPEQQTKTGVRVRVMARGSIPSVCFCCFCCIYQK